MTEAESGQAGRTPLVYVCVLNWNSHEDTLRCVAALARSTYKNARVVVADNASAEESVKALRESGLPFEWILNPSNLGFTGGSNLVMRYGLERGADYVWLMNSDALVEPNALEKLIAAAEAHPQAGILSPVIYFDSDPRVLQSCGMELDLETGRFDDLPSLDAADEFMRKEQQRYCLWGTAMLIRRAVIETVGFLDEQFFAYWEDMDYCARARAAGFELRVVPEAAVLHGRLPGPLSNADLRPHRSFYRARNAILFWKKHTSGLKRLRYVYWRAATPLRLIYSRPMDQVSADLTVDGIWCGLTGKAGVWTEGNRHLKAPPLVKKLLLAYARWLTPAPRS